MTIALTTDNVPTLRIGRFYHKTLLFPSHVEVVLDMIFLKAFWYDEIKFTVTTTEFTTIIDTSFRLKDKCCQQLNFVCIVTIYLS